MTPQKMRSPLLGVFLYNLSFSLVEVIAVITDYLVYLDLMLFAPLNSCASSFEIFTISSLGGMTKETILVPFLYKSLGKE